MHTFTMEFENDTWKLLRDLITTGEFSTIPFKSEKEEYDFIRYMLSMGLSMVLVEMLKTVDQENPGEAAMILKITGLVRKLQRDMEKGFNDGLPEDQPNVIIFPGK